MKMSNPFAKMTMIRIVLKDALIKYASYFSAIIIIFFCCLQNSYAQITITTNDPSATTVTSPGTITITSSGLENQNYQLLITGTSATGTVALDVASAINPASGLTADAPTTDGTGTHILVHGNSPVASPTPSDWFFELTATAPSTPALDVNIFIKIRKSVDLMFVLDKSGSMGTIISGTETRWTKLKSGVAQVFANYQPNLSTVSGPNGDQIGIRMFSTTDAAPANAPFNVPNLISVTKTTPINTSATDPAAILGGDIPDGFTAMGMGLEAAKTSLVGGPDNQHKKAMILFTDGEQNIPPPSGNVVALANTNPSITGIDPDLTKNDRIQINTIGLGIAGAASQTLYYLAHESGNPPGKTNIPTPASDPQLDALNFPQALLDISQNVLSGSSPQFVDVRRSNFKSIGNFFGAVDSFVVSKNIDKIFVNLLCDVRNEARVSGIQKDGQNLSLFDTSYINSTGGAGWQTFVISVSGIKKKIPGFKSDGTWVVLLSSSSELAGSSENIPYILSFTVDDHTAEMIGTTAQTKELVVGGNLPLSIALTKNGAPITGANAIAIVAKPGDDLGDLLARTNVQFNVDTGADAGSVGNQKYQELLKDSAFVKKLLDSNHAVNLTYNASQKKYVGEFNQLDVSGVYQVAYIVSVNDSTLGQINRYSEESIYIRFPDIDAGKSNITVSTLNNVTTLTFRPIATNNKFVGPGWGGGITLTGSGGDNKIAKIVDNGDGTYTITVNGPLTGQGALTVGGDNVYQGNLANIGKGGNGGGTEIWKQWWFWLILIIILLIIWIVSRRKKNP